MFRVFNRGPSPGNSLLILLRIVPFENTQLRVKAEFLKTQVPGAFSDLATAKAERPSGSAHRPDWGEADSYTTTIQARHSSPSGRRRCHSADPEHRDWPRHKLQDTIYAYTFYSVSQERFWMSWKMRPKPRARALERHQDTDPGLHMAALLTADSFQQGMMMSHDFENEACVAGLLTTLGRDSGLSSRAVHLAIVKGTTPTYVRFLCAH